MFLKNCSTTVVELFSGQKTRREYHLLRTYDIHTVGGTLFLIKKDKKKHGNGSVEYVVCFEDLYERIYDIHINKTKHGGRDKILNTIRGKLNIPRPAVDIFLSCCKSCCEKRVPKMRFDMLHTFQ